MRFDSGGVCLKCIFFEMTRSIVNGKTVVAGDVKARSPNTSHDAAARPVNGVATPTTRRMWTEVN